MAVFLLAADIGRAKGDAGGILVVGSEQDYPPFAIGQTDATADGFTVDLWKEVAARQLKLANVKALPISLDADAEILLCRA